jgi:pimeloyl-ACP methyl ester carboxylesterase
MNRRSLSLLLVAVSSCAVAAVGACSSGNSGSPGKGSSGDGGSGPDATNTTEAGAGDSGAPYSVQVPCTDTPDSIYQDPGTLPATAGAIIRCAHYEDFTAAQLLAEAQTPDLLNDGGISVPGYTGPAFPSGAHVYRVLYRTERGDTNNTPGYSSALVFIPDTPKAAQSPVIVASHGSRGQAPQCAPSTDNDAGAYVEGDFKRQVYPLVGAGYAVIAPDLAGYANFGATNNPPSAYADVLDVGKSTLDGARALKLILGSSLQENVILVGHSQGGGTALGALTLASTYAPELTIAGVAVYSPLWLSARLNGAFLLLPSKYPLATTPEGPVIIWYLYTHSELLDGPGHGLDLFNTDKQAAITQFVNNDCWEATYPTLNDAGVVITDLVSQSFASAIGSVAAGFPASATCASNSSDPTLCNTWMSRFEADWPHIAGAAAKIPILSLYGAQDQTITPDLAACVFDRYASDQANVTVCLDPTAGHSSLVAFQADYVNQWIAALVNGGAQPAPCKYNQNNLVEDDAGVVSPGDDAGKPVQCNTLVPPT